MWKTLALLIWASVVLAAAPEGRHRALGQSGDWRAHAYADGRGAACILSSRAIVSLPKAVGDRGAVFYIARYRSAEGWFYELAMFIGAAAAPQRAISMQIGNQRFDFIVGASRSGAEAEWAWIKAIDTKKALAAMRGGYDMEITAWRDDGLALSDRYSLLGVSKGLVMLEAECA